MTTSTHQALQTKYCLPTVHIVDCGYMSAQAIVTGQRDYGIDLLDQCAQIPDGKLVSTRAFHSMIS